VDRDQNVFPALTRDSRNAVQDKYRVKGRREEEDIRMDVVGQIMGFPLGYTRYQDGDDRPLQDRQRRKVRELAEATAKAICSAFKITNNLLVALRSSPFAHRSCWATVFVTFP